MPDSTRSAKPKKPTTDRPKKPSKKFPLYAHASGHWAKKIGGRFVYFGRWGRRVKGQMVREPNDGWEAALKLYEAEEKELRAGRTPPRGAEAEGVKVKYVCNKFLAFKSAAREAGDIGPRLFAEYRSTTDRIIDIFGKDRLVDDLKPTDFTELRTSIAKTCGPIRLGNEVTRIKTVFKYAVEEQVIKRPVFFGVGFKKPKKQVLRRHKTERGERLFEASEIRSILGVASTQLRAMVLLAINCGFGNGDCSSLPVSRVKLDSGFVDYPRPKTGIARRCPLWPETLEALRTAIESRPEPTTEDAQRSLFVTRFGRRWVRTEGKYAAPVDSIGLEFNKLLRKLQIKRPGVSFYALRHTFRTIADGAKDTTAIRRIMGHADHSIDDTYRERIDDHRLVAVTDHVRAWLFPADGEGEPCA